MRRTKATLIHRRTGNLRAVQLLLGHSKIESTVLILASKSTTPSRSPRKSMSDLPGQSGPALPSAQLGISCQETLHRSKQHCYSATSSARSSSTDKILNPRLPAGSGVPTTRSAYDIVDCVRLVCADQYSWLSY